jgi:hypothetical protein
MSVRSRYCSASEEVERETVVASDSAAGTSAAAEVVDDESEGG